MLICKAKHLLYQSIYLLQKMGESTSKFDFERIVPVFLREPSRSVFCANRPGRIVPGRNWFLRETSRNPFIYIELKEGKRSDNTRKCMLFAFRMLLSASICLSTLQKHEGGFVLILKSAWGVLSTLNYWAWGVLSAFKKT